ncbi:MAG: beta-lactamase family protein [Dehalococcoidales bacterium]|nr:beta-lactamase family protein [Dehalococcoidales bacterium]
MNENLEADKELLVELVNSFIEKMGVPGIAVGILFNGQTITAGCGVTSVENPLPVTDETLFQIGSLTKTYTATAIMRLVETGKIDLDATVRTYIPDFTVADETASSAITVRHLLTHTGGFEGDIFDDTGSGDDALARYVANLSGLEPLAPFGKIISYCNAGFSVLGHIIEKVTGKSYQAAVTELVLDPLGLSGSYFEPGDVMTHRFATGHFPTPEGTMVARPWPLSRSAYPAGGITCHVNDLLRYARFHMGDGSVNDDERLLSPESMTLMQSPQASVWGNHHVGLSWWIEDMDGVRKIDHGGGTLGQVSSFEMVPEKDFALIVLTNDGRGELVIKEMRRWAYNRYLELEIPEPKPVPSTEEMLAEYAGFYGRTFADIEMGMLAGRLVLQLKYKQGFPTQDSPPSPPPPPMSMGLCEKDRLIVLDGPMGGVTVDVIRKEDGTIGWIRAGLRLYVREP